MQRGTSEAPSDQRLKSIFIPEVYGDWIERERRVSAYYRKTFTRTERLILFCMVVCDWSRRVIEEKTGISQRQINNFYERVREWENG